MASRKQDRLTKERMEDRLVPAGALDATGDTDGLRRRDFCANHTGRAVAVQQDGKVIIAGSDGDDFVVARFQSNGTLDFDFNGAFPFGGSKKISFGGIDTATAVAIQDDGKIVVTGYSSLLGQPT